MIQWWIMNQIPEPSVQNNFWNTAHSSLRGEQQISRVPLESRCQASFSKCVNCSLGNQVNGETCATGEGVRGRGRRGRTAVSAEIRKESSAQPEPLRSCIDHPSIQKWELVIYQHGHDGRHRLFTPEQEITVENMAEANNMIRLRPQTSNRSTGRSRIPLPLNPHDIHRGVLCWARQYGSVDDNLCHIDAHVKCKEKTVFNSVCFCETFVVACLCSGVLSENVRGLSLLTFKVWSAYLKPRCTSTENGLFIQVGDISLMR